MNDGNGFDWDGELQTLMEASGITTTELKRPHWAKRLRRKASRARAALITTGVVVPVMWIVAHCGAPAAAITPALVWLAGVIAVSSWVSLGRPDWAISATIVRRISITVFHAGSRFGFARTRPLRVRWRAWRAAREREATESGPITA
ncbi:hypothetical protein [Nocardia arthritidis]|uniref:Uncharacterized protein n=1 Tax=Nocardia arthritidis TaxID=228602 RepID=A0A6G9YCL6_9NOCA|nr:hypothetical protein [Nocardia arthritidis]QIS10753.1 hypothetical protein F5544_14330 [Nocardia arthritidis]